MLSFWSAMVYSVIGVEKYNQIMTIYGHHPIGMVTFLLPNIVGASRRAPAVQLCTGAKIVILGGGGGREGMGG